MILKKKKKKTLILFSQRKGDYWLVTNIKRLQIKQRGTAYSVVPRITVGYLLLFIFHGGRSERVSKAPRVHRFDLASRLPVSSNDFLSQLPRSCNHLYIQGVSAVNLLGQRQHRFLSASFSFSGKKSRKIRKKKERKKGKITRRI